MNNKGTKYGIILLLIILALTGANLLFGSVNIPAEDDEEQYDTVFCSFVIH